MSVEQAVTEVNTIITVAKYIGAGLACIGIAGGGIGVGIATKGLLEAVARQPELKGESFKNFLIGAGLAEATSIYALFIAIVLIFVAK